MIIKSTKVPLLISVMLVMSALLPFIDVAVGEHDPVDPGDIDLDGLLNNIDPDMDNDGLLNDDETQSGEGIVVYIHQTDEGEMEWTDNNVYFSNQGTYSLKVHAYSTGGGGMGEEHLNVIFGGEQDPRIITPLNDGWYTYADNDELTYQSLSPGTYTLEVSGALFDLIEVRWDDGELDPYDADIDDDGLLDGTEVGSGQGETFGTSPLNPDSDGDGLKDGLEVGRGYPEEYNPAIPYNAITDWENDHNKFTSNLTFNVGDGWVDLDISTYTDPLNPDTDGDGLLDGEEDENKNGRVDEGETDPNDSDTDDDGLSDWLEINFYNTDPLDPDTDGDGLWDGWHDDGDEIYLEDEEKGERGQEFEGGGGSGGYGTQPLLVDTDDDGLWDGWDIEGNLGEFSSHEINGNFYTPTEPLNPDSDGDGLVDGLELGVSGYDGDGGTTTTDPNNPDSDDDEIEDGVEDYNGNGVYDEGTELDPNNADTDSDYVNDGLEGYQQYTWDYDFDCDGKINALDTDSDNDGVLDGNEDLDHNGVVAPDETNPVNEDTDGDGLWDGYDIDGHYGELTNQSGYEQTDPTKWDTDGDGLSDGLEVGLINDDDNGATTTDPNDADTDDDGILDGDEDFNQNGVWEAVIGDSYNESNWGTGGETDPLKLDSDGDFIQDGTELGIFYLESSDTDPNIFQPDVEFVIHTTDPIDIDADNDGLLDGFKDNNENGIFDEGIDEGEDTNLNGWIDGDSNCNRMIDIGETWTESDPSNSDTDGDGWSDYNEGYGDPWGDTDDPDDIPNILDKDSDDDGILDGREDYGPHGSDGVFNAGEETNALCNDTDNDTIPDGMRFMDNNQNGYYDSGDIISETGEDINCDGVVTNNEADPKLNDTDGDGINDNLEGYGYYNENWDWQDGNWYDDCDEDGYCNAHDRDSDNDGLPDGWIDGWGWKEGKLKSQENDNLDSIEMVTLSGKFGAWGLFYSLNDYKNYGEFEDYNCDGNFDLEGTLPESYPLLMNSEIWNEKGLTDGIEDGKEIVGWDIIIDQGTDIERSRHVRSWPAFYDSEEFSEDDGDDLGDDYEFLRGTDPRDSDTDSDGLKDGDELYKHNTYPLYGDSDLDGVQDGWDIAPNENLKLIFKATRLKMDYWIDLGGEEPKIKIEVEGCDSQTYDLGSGGNNRTITAPPKVFNIDDNLSSVIYSDGKISIKIKVTEDDWIFDDIIDVDGKHPNGKNCDITFDPYTLTWTGDDENSTDRNKTGHTSGNGDGGDDGFPEKDGELWYDVYTSDDWDKDGMINFEEEYIYNTNVSEPNKRFAILIATDFRNAHRDLGLLNDDLDQDCTIGDYNREQALWNDITAMYDTLIGDYNYKDENIYVVYNQPSDLSFEPTIMPDIIHDPRDNWFYNLTCEHPNYATVTDLQNAFEWVGGKMTDEDFLFVQVAAHGVYYNNTGQSCFKFNSFSISDEEFSNPQGYYVGKIENYKHMTFFIGSCKGGHFNDTLTQNDPNNITVITATDTEHYSWQCDDPWFATYWLNLSNAILPSDRYKDDPMVLNADNDSFVPYGLIDNERDMSELFYHFISALRHRTFPTHPNDYYSNFLNNLEDHVEWWHENKDDDEDRYNYSHNSGDPVFSSYSYSMRYINADTDNNGFISMNEAFSYALSHDSSYYKQYWDEEHEQWERYEIPLYTNNGGGIYL